MSTHSGDKKCKLYVLELARESFDVRTCVHLRQCCHALRNLHVSADQVRAYVETNFEDDLRLCEVLYHYNKLEAVEAAIFHASQLDMEQHVTYLLEHKEFHTRMYAEAVEIAVLDLIAQDMDGV